MNICKRTIRTNSWWAFAYRMALAYFFFGIARGLFYFFNYRFFADMTAEQVWRAWMGGLRFDTASVLYLNALFILLSFLPFRFRTKRSYRILTDWAFFVPNALGLAAGLADCIYYPYTLKRTSSTVFSEFSHEGGGLIWHLLLNYWYMSLLAIVLVTAMVWLYHRVKPVRTYAEEKGGLHYYTAHAVALVAAIAFIVWGIRGGSFAKSWRPMTMSYANLSVDKVEHRALVLNTPYSIIRTIGKQGLEEKRFYASEKELEQVFNPIHHLAMDTTARFGQLRGRNVMVIIIESFARQYVGRLNQDIPDYKGYTPCFDSISQKGYLFEQAFANGRKSIDAMPSILSSLPSLRSHFITSHYSGNEIEGLGTALGHIGYQSIFLHGAPNGSMGFDAFVKQAGYKRYFGKTEYARDEDFDGVWGIWDEPFLLHAVDELSRMKQPFVGTLFTLSSHEPFRIPSHYKGRFPNEGEPLVQCIGYTDHALGEFFRKASLQPWFENTLFVITADHASGDLRPEYRSAVGRYAVPILFYAPGSDLIGFDRTTTVQQADILPTVLSLLGYSAPVLAFGNNMFSRQAPHFAVTDYDGTLQLLGDGFVLQHDGNRPLALYDYLNDKELHTNLIKTQTARADSMTRRIEAVIQSFNHRMNTNRLIADK